MSVEDGKQGYASMKALSGVTVTDIKDAATEMVDPGATVVTDGFLAYTLSLASYEHKVKVTGDTKTAARKLPWVHILIANAKAMISDVHHGVSKAHLQEHLSEFCWRFSRRGHTDELFDRLLCCCLCLPEAAPLTDSVSSCSCLLCHPGVLKLGQKG